MATVMPSGPHETLAARAPGERRAGATTPPASRPWARFFATTTGLLYLLPGTLAMATLSCLVSWVPPRGNAVAFLARQWAKGILAATGVKVEVELDPAIEPGRGYVVMANHQSYFDVVAMLAVLPGTYRFVAKRSLFVIPIFGWSLWAGGFIPVDRRDKSKAREVWRAAGRRLERGASVLFYPEGTRSHDGRIHAFQRGAFLVALKTGAPILPVGISGAHEVMPRGRLSVVPGTIRVRFGAPIEPRSFGVRSKHDLIGHVRTTISELSGIELAETVAAPAADG
jgi:1-acyl-sn-glycerol-3-phosphate acyltransferase